jgi:hypothetical protein
MAAVTLFLTRFPKDEFFYNRTTGENEDDIDDLSADDFAARYTRTVTRGKKEVTVRIKQISGLWGTMLMIVGPEVWYASTLRPWSGILFPDEMIDTLTIGRQQLHLVRSKDDIVFSKQFTTMERYRTDSGELNQWGFGYVRMVSRDDPYDLRTERGNKVVATIRPGHNGECVRVLGGATAQQRAILIHEGPDARFIVGCIAPRPLNDREAYSRYDSENPSARTVREIIGRLNAHGGGKGKFYVLKQ